MIAFQRPAAGLQLARHDGAGAAQHDRTRVEPNSDVRDAPVVVLTYAHSGAARLQSLLAPHPGLACTSGTGILPLCEQAAVAWRMADDRDGMTLSPLALASVRALATGIITSMLIRTGKRRWCELATASPVSAETFLQIYPGTRFVCLHRSCPDMVYAALHASPWGLAGPAFAPFTATHPGSAVAALTAYWAAHAGPLVTFEESHPAVCHRVRYEDLTGGSRASALFAFLGMEIPGAGMPGAHDASDNTAEPGAAGCATPIPAGQIPPQLLAQANDLAGKLGYPPLAPIQ